MESIPGFLDVAKFADFWYKNAMSGELKGRVT